MFNIIPAIDIIEGKVVRLTQGDYNRVNNYEQTPTELAQYYQDSGATRIHLVDLEGAKDGQLKNIKTIEAIRQKVTCTLELGGGIRSKETAKTLFDAGIDLLILGSLFVKDPDTALALCEHYPNRFIAGIDAKQGQVAVEGWLEKSDLSVNTLLTTLEQVAVESVIFTDIEKDGTLKGPNLNALRDVAQHTKIPIIASGGVSCDQDILDLKALESIGVSGCIVGKAILAGKVTIPTLFD